MKKLFYGDNLQILREQIADESVDLIYLDPPFNSKRDYNLLFKTPKGHESDAQITAFEDTWHWGGQAQDEFRDLMKCGNTDVSQMMEALRAFLGENDMMAYLTMMANRLLEMHRVLKRTGSLYLHCDPTASHYLKIVLDGVFGKANFVNEIVWRRSGAHNDSKRYGANHDVIFFFAKTNRWTWNPQFTSYSDDYIEGNYRYKDETGRMFRVSDMTANKPGGDVSYDWQSPDGRIVKPYKGRYWAYSKQNMKQMDEKGLIYYRTTGMPMLKHYLDEMPGVPLQTFWNEPSPIISGSPERLRYPTQKPFALLERIIAASSNEGDVVLDPFCGCGTALDAAQKLKRSWIGIDITHLAVSLIEKRLKARYPELQSGRGSQAKPVRAEPVEAQDASSPSTGSGRTDYFEIIGVPQDFAGARDLAERDKHQFQLWSCSLVGVQPYRGGKKGADQGIDGMGFIEVAKGKTEKVLVSVKGGENVGASMIRDLKGTVEREKAAIGLFVTLTPPTKPMVTEAASAGHYESPHHGAFPKIQILTIAGLLDGTERPHWPDMSFGEQNFKKAKAAGKSSKQKVLFEE